MKKRMLLSGNEAIALAAVHSSISVATAYPGTPSTEIIATISQMVKNQEADLYVEWSVNEKVAFEIAAAAAIAGARALTAMKMVGLNVAADPLTSQAYLGVKGGLVLVVADDPGPHSSQTEQDTRIYAKLAKLPVLEPSSPQDAYDMTLYAFSLSEQLELPVIIRPTTRVCHAGQDVRVQGNISGKSGSSPSLKPGFVRHRRWVMLPSLAAERHRWLNQQLERARQLLAESPFNFYRHVGRENADNELGIIASGPAFLYVLEALELMGIDARVCKIGTPYPLPFPAVDEILDTCRVVVVVEEPEPVIEEQVIYRAWQRRLPVVIKGKLDGTIPREGELNVDRLYAGIAAAAREAGGNINLSFTSPAPNISSSDTKANLDLPPRPPIMCAGCPHRNSFYIFKKMAPANTVFTGDIGCYTLGTMPPLQAIDTCLCMGAGLAQAQGFYRVEPERRYVAFVGDSTFFHAGLPPVINAVHNRVPLIVVVLDNRSTAMTGHQPHPGLEKTASGQPASAIDIAAIARASGIKEVMEVDPYDLPALTAIAQKAYALAEPVLVVARRPCIQIVKEKRQAQIDPNVCTGCLQCQEESGCPALQIVYAGTSEATIRIRENCSGCGLCAYICPAGAITITQEVRAHGS